ncbi:stage II sporulation protein E [Leptospira ryugenii]|uniref:Stage II sporulation protein E n=1 Tax=Leptospira ryugenii TaxID=1917863 RepID=A0A2P2E2G7_9LEPT|nr:7TM diverse intracellular signaling domain-containing protein [Leptospira ryugenii]GBF51071.1 stage II sporulation protein E [Leptospira ryugenii]
MRTLLSLGMLSLFLTNCAQTPVQKAVKENSFLPSVLSYTDKEIEIGSENSPFPNLNDFNQKTILKNSTSLGFHKNPIWFCIKATNKTNSDTVIFDLGNPQLDDVKIYQADSFIPIKTGGDLIPHSNWEVDSRNISFSIPWKPNEEKTFFVSIRSSSHISITPKFFAKDAFFQKESFENLILGFFYGTIAIMILYNLFIYFILKDTAYILYCGAILFNLLLQIYLNGILNRFFTYHTPEIHNRIGTVFLCGSAIFGWLFADQSLNLKTLNKKTHTTLLLLVAGTIIYFFVSILFFPLNWTVRISNFLAQVFVLSVFLAAIVNYLKGNKKAKLFILGWSVLLLGILLYALMQNGSLPANLVTIYSNQIGSTLEAGILSLALAKKINQLKEEKTLAQAEALSHLEEKVLERTRILDESLFTIKKDLSTAKKIQQTFFSEIRAVDPRIQLKTFYQSMTEVGGDFYDLTQVSPDHYRIFVADATGHGIQAALITMAIKAEYESLKMIYDHPNDLIFHLNQIFINKYKNVHAVFSCAVCDIEFSKGKLLFASAGHPEQLFIRSGETKLLPRTGKIIGMKDHAEYRSLEYYIQEGDRVYLFTDGVFEQFNADREIFGEDRVYEWLSEHQRLDLDKSIESLIQELNFFTKFNTHQDDITIVGCEIGSF